MLFVSPRVDCVDDIAVHDFEDRPWWNYLSIVEDVVSLLPNVKHRSLSSNFPYQRGSRCRVKSHPREDFGPRTQPLMSRC